MKPFQIGQNSFEVCQTIVDNHPEIVGTKLISHVVGKNWREINNTKEDKIKNLISGIGHLNPIRHERYRRDNFLNLSLSQLPQLDKHQVWSMTSCVGSDAIYDTMHIPMMNFHPDGIGLQEIKEAIKIIAKNKSGVILDSGRYFHYYGNFLLTERDWISWMAEFLGPCILVSPRYIGHRLHHGYSTLRLTSDSEFKPKVPQVIEIIN